MHYLRVFFVKPLCTSPLCGVCIRVHLRLPEAEGPNTQQALVAAHTVDIPERDGGTMALTHGMIACTGIPKGAKYDHRNPY